MVCPHAGCGNAIASTEAVCITCRRPVFVCSQCNTANRSFARSCRHCGTKVSFVDRPIPVLDNFYDHVSKDFKEDKVWEFFRLSPHSLSYRGHLWLVTNEGDVLRISGGNDPQTIASLQGDGYVYPPFIDQIETEGPVLFINNEEAIYSISLLRDRVNEEFTVNKKIEQLLSGVVAADSALFVLSRASGSLHLRRIGSSSVERPVEGNLSSSWRTNPVLSIGNSIALLTQENLTFFNFSLLQEKKLEWNPWRVLPTRSGVWYSVKNSVSDARNTQSVYSVGTDHESRLLSSKIPVTAKFCVNPSDGRLAILSSNSISVFGLNRQLNKLQAGVIDIVNATAPLLVSNFLIWFEVQDRSIYLWRLEEQNVHRLFTFDEEVQISDLFYVNGALFGIDKDFIWRWDLSGF